MNLRFKSIKIKAYLKRQPKTAFLKLKWFKVLSSIRFKSIWKDLPALLYSNVAHAKMPTANSTLTRIEQQIVKVLQFFWFRDSSRSLPNLSMKFLSSINFWLFRVNIRFIKGLSLEELLIVCGRFDRFTQTFTKSAGF